MRAAAEAIHEDRNTMNAADITPFAPAAATVNKNLQQKLARVILNEGGGIETTIELNVYYDMRVGFYHGSIGRTVKKLNPTTGRMIFVKQGPNETFKARLLSTRESWSEERLDTMYAKAFETLGERLAAGEEKVMAVLADMK